MSNQKEKERWQKIQENKKKTCKNCSQLFWDSLGNQCCRYDDGTKKTQHEQFIRSHISSKLMNVLINTMAKTLNSKQNFLNILIGGKY